MSDQDSKSSGTKRKVTVRRRRRTESTAGARQQAEAPKRRKEQRPSAPPPSAPPPRPPSSSSPRPSSGARPSLPRGKMNPKMLLILIGIVLVLVLCCGLNMLRGGSQDAGDTALQQPAQPIVSQQAEPTRAPATPTPKPFTPPASTSGNGDTWLVMLYQDADDKVLEKDILVDLNEAERIGSSDNVHIVAQVDRYRKGYRGDGDWDSTKRFYVTYDPDLNRVSSQEIADLGEVNMADGDSLVDFVTWAIETFPADKHALILSDHGMGWPGGWSDKDSGGRGDHNIALAQMGDQLFLMEMDQALGEIRERTGLEKFELIGLDACLMSHVEVYDALAPHARYAVASQETEPALGWAYTGFLDALVKNPGMSGEDLGRLIVQSYIQEDQRIVDEQARADLLRGSARGFGLPSAAQVAQQMEGSTTLSAVDLQALPQVIASLNNLAAALQEIDQRPVAQARNYAQSYTSVFGRGSPPSYIDLGHFVQMLKRETRSSAVTQAADQVLAALDKSVVAERHGAKKAGSTGMSIYFPNSKLFQHPAAGPESYTTVANRFAADSLWDDFLTFHYTGRQFDPALGAISVPDKDAPVAAPGVGKITVGAIKLSDDVAAPGKPILVSTDIDGENIGYILFFTGYLDETSNSIFVADMDYLESADTREVNGVYYPDWGEGEFELEFEWEPLMFGVDDGRGAELALFKPESYGAAPENAVYPVDGIYTFADDGETRNARLYFSDGELQQVFSFMGDDASGAPREIVPSGGDTFTVLEQWMDQDTNGRVSGIATQEGGTVAFGEQPLAWADLDAAPGQYIIGFIVQDLDGNSYPVYEKVTVR